MSSQEEEIKEEKDGKKNAGWTFERGNPEAKPVRHGASSISGALKFTVTAFYKSLWFL